MKIITSLKTIYRALIGITLLSLFICGCCRDATVQCGPEIIQPAFIGYSSTDIDTFVIRKYKQDDHFNTLLDTFMITTSPYTGEAFLTSHDTLSTYLQFGISGVSVSEIQTGFDWTIYIPATNQTDSISHIINYTRPATATCRICGDGSCYCIDAIDSIKTNGVQHTYTDTIGTTYNWPWVYSTYLKLYFHK